jgi:hypothetical protein
MKAQTHAYAHIVILLYGGIEHLVLWICGGVGVMMYYFTFSSFSTNSSVLSFVLNVMWELWCVWTPGRVAVAAKTCFLFVIMGYCM